MASRVLGFFLGLLFIALSLVPFVDSYLKNTVITTIAGYYRTYSLWVLPIPSIVLFLVGLFCLQSAIRDTWPFYG
ncbi:MAG: hypothetical protein WC307_00680 [Candidatus Nanoarchaeia archaeon]